MAVYRYGNRTVALIAAAPAVLVVSACGSQRDSSRVAAMIEAKYGVNVISCVSHDDNTPLVGRWRCDLSSPRTDKNTGIADTAWCVTNATPDDEFESARLAYPRAIPVRGCS
jgi:hypothetical protein